MALIEIKDLGLTYETEKESFIPVASRRKMAQHLHAVMRAKRSRRNPAATDTRAYSEKERSIIEK